MTTSAVDSNTLASLGLALQNKTSSKTGSQNVNQADFLTLLTAQLKNQDPTKPMDNSQFVSQLAQISTVSGIQGLQDSITGLSSSLTSNQALQAASLVGHKVLVAGGDAYLPAGGKLEGAAQISSSGQLSVDVVDSSGQVLRTLDLGTQPAGLANFSWDGTTSGGATAVPGTYHLQARVNASGNTVAATTYGAAPVTGVEVASTGVTLDLNGLNPVALSSVRQILQ